MRDIRRENAASSASFLLNDDARYLETLFSRSANVHVNEVNITYSAIYWISVKVRAKVRFLNKSQAVVIVKNRLY